MLTDTITVHPFDNRGRVRTQATVTFREIEPAANGDRRIEAVAVEYGSNSTSVYRFVDGVFFVEISDGSLRPKSASDCRQNGLSLHPLYCEPTQQNAYNADTEAFLSEYRRIKANYEPTGEELAEMRANFPGRTAVNVITGRRTKLR